MERLRQWWQRVTGKAAAAAGAPARTGAGRQSAATQTPPAGELSLAEDTPEPHGSRLGEAGFDPYSSDAGYAKPHSWERVDHD